MLCKAEKVFVRARAQYAQVVEAADAMIESADARIEAANVDKTEAERAANKAGRVISNINSIIGVNSVIAEKSV